MAEMTPEQKRKAKQSMQDQANMPMPMGDLTEALRQKLGGAADAINPLTNKLIENKLQMEKSPDLPANTEGVSKAKAMMGITPDSMAAFGDSQKMRQLEQLQKDADMAELSGDADAQAKAQMQLELLKKMRGY